jgi:DNA-binding CsgD family transcriptional regulator
MTAPHRLVGRDDEVRVLGAAFEACVERVAVVTLGGEAGVGKSALIDSLAGHAAAAGDQVLRGGCTVVLSEPIPYAPIAGALRSAGISTKELGAVNRAELFEGILARLVAARDPAGRQLLALEDLHWSDVGTMELVGFLARNLPAGHLVALTYRTDEPPADPAAQVVLEAIAASRQVRRLDVQRLSMADVAKLFTEHRQRPASEHELQILQSRSGGNPFIVTELIEAGVLDTLPPRLQDVLTMRAAGLEPDAHRVVQSLAVLGRPVSQQLLDGIAGLTPDATLDAVAECVAAGIVVVEPGGREYAFRHALTQEALLAQMLPGERQRIHQRIALALDALPQLRSGAGGAAEWAAHWRASGDDERAFEVTTVAAEKAERAFAHTDCWRQYQHLIELLDAGYGPTDDAERCRVIGGAADAARRAGDTAESVTLAQRAADCAHEPGERATALERLGRCRWDDGDMIGATSAYLDAESAAKDLPASELHATIAASRARLAMNAGRYEDAKALAEQAIEIAERTDASADHSRALGVLGMCQVFGGDLEDGISVMREAAELAEVSGDDEDRRRVAANLAFSLLIAGHTQDACQVAVQALAAARRQNAFVGTGAVLVNNTIVLLRIAGRWDEAEQLSEEAFAEGVTAGQALLIRLARAELDMARGEQELARENLDAAAYLGHLETSISITADLALAEASWALAEGQLDQASTAIDQALAVLDTGSENRDLARACALGLRIEADRVAEPTARRGQGTSHQVAGPDHAQRLRGAAQRLDAVSASPEVAAFCRLAEAEWDRLQQEPTAGSRWADVADRWAVLERPFEQAYARFRLAEVLLKDDRAAGVEALTTAHRIAGELRAAPLLAEIVDLGRRSRVRLTAPVPSSSGEPADEFGLTRREREVLGELSLGLTNKQIAARLFLSPRTVDVHVGNVLMKLGARTRAEATATAIRSGLALDEADGVAGVTPAAVAPIDGILPRQLSRSASPNSAYGAPNPAGAPARPASGPENPKKGAPR